MSGAKKKPSEQKNTISIANQVMGFFGVAGSGNLDYMINGLSFRTAIPKYIYQSLVQRSVVECS